MVNFSLLKTIIETEFSDIVVQVNVTQLNEIRVILRDNSFIEIWYSLQLHNRFSLHWERKFIDKTIYRHDNIPHKKWHYVKTFPKHFHNGTEENVTESYISENIEDSAMEFLKFVRRKLNDKE